jgi:hypothetical protein
MCLRVVGSGGNPASAIPCLILLATSTFSPGAETSVRMIAQDSHLYVYFCGRHIMTQQRVSPTTTRILFLDAGEQPAVNLGNASFASSGFRDRRMSWALFPT